MTTSTRKDGPGSKPSKTDSKKGRSTPSPEERKKMHDALRAAGKDLGFKEVPLKGAIIWIPEGTLF